MSVVCKLEFATFQYLNHVKPRFTPCILYQLLLVDQVWACLTSADLAADLATLEGDEGDDGIAEEVMRAWKDAAACQLQGFQGWNMEYIEREHRKGR